MPSTRNQKNVSNRFDIATEHDTRLINNFSRVHADWRDTFELRNGRKEREEQGIKEGEGGRKEKKKGKEREERNVRNEIEGAR